MKKFLLLSVAALMVVSANAQLKRSEVNVPKLPKAERVQMNLQKKEAKAAPVGASVNKAPKKAGYIEPFYYRPAGAFYGSMIAVDGVGGYSYSNDFLLMKPYKDATFRTFVDGGDENTFYTWDFFHGPEDELEMIDGEDVTIQYGLSTQSMPKFYAVDGDPDSPSSKWYEYQMTNYEMDGSSDAPTVKSQAPVQAWVIPCPEVITDEEGIDFMLSSKTTCGGGRNADQRYIFTAYYGAEPYGDNQNGWWFGKNGEHIDGLAQAFEKPENPYLLKKVYMMLGDDLICNGNVKLTCKVYKLDEIPAYDDSTSVGLPEIPGELVVTGEALVTPETGTAKNGFVEFTLFGFDEDDPELTYEFSPTIDYPILIVVDGYNDPEAEDLADFTCYISADDQVDEGYGELAYLKYPRYIVELDENGDTVFDEQGEPVYDFTGEYFWRGLNNFFRSGQMKTAFAVFVTADQPFVTYNLTAEDGEYTFPDEGGLMTKEFVYSDTTIVAESIEFYSWTPSADGDWMLTYNGSDELPEWLNIELEDLEDYEGYGWLVNAKVTADPLPEGVTYRSAVIRFEIPGDFIEYKFRQGESGGIEETLIDNDDNAVPVGYYDVTGRQLNGLQSGVNIVKMSNGTAKKVFKK